MLPLRRFISKHGCPEIIIYNNFNSLESGEVKSFVTSKGITCNFILESSSWWGGFYKRLDAIVKNSLKKVLRKKEADFFITSLPLI